MKSKANFKVTDTALQLTEKINRALAISIDNAASKIDPNIGLSLGPLLLSKWRSSATYNSLISGDLNGKFGFYKGTAKDKVDNILEEAAISIKVAYVGTRIFKTKFKTEIRIYILKEDLLGILESIDAVIVSEKGATLEWARWLLTRGDEIVVDKYRFYGKGGLGRSGRGIMERGLSFKVPTAHSGVIGDNWLTKVLRTFIAEISVESRNIIEQEIKRNL